MANPYLNCCGSTTFFICFGTCIKLMRIFKTYNKLFLKEYHFAREKMRDISLKEEVYYTNTPGAREKLSLLLIFMYSSTYSFNLKVL